MDSTKKTGTGTDPEQWVRESDEALAKVDSYTAIFHKQERVGGKLLEEETIFLKFKRPFKVYMKWMNKPFKGRETLFAEGWNGGEVRAHEGGLLGIVSVNLDPRGSLAMKGNRHPITDAGIEGLMQKIGANLRRGLQNDELTLREHADEVVAGRKTRKVEAIYPRVEDKGHYCHRAVLNLDLELKVPIKIQIFDWGDQLAESYLYEDLKLGAGLMDADFDPKNPDYRF